MTQKATIIRINWVAIVVICAALSLPFTGTAHADNGKSTMKAGTGVEINIGSNGGVLVRGAKVTSVSGSTVSANTSLGSSVLTWTVQTNDDTEFVTANGANTGLSGIAVGDIISFRGTLDQSVSGLNVNAKTMKDWSQAETRRTVSGVITAINATLDSFTVSKDNATTTVQTNSSTRFLKDGRDASFSDLLVDTDVKVAGFWSASSSVLTASVVTIDTDGDDARGMRGWWHGNRWFRFW